MDFFQQHAFALTAFSILAVVAVVVWRRPKAPGKRMEAVAVFAGCTAVVLAVVHRYIYQ